MKKQLKPYWCGPASIQNALRCFGKKYNTPQKKIAELCGTTPDGTDEYMMMRGMDALGMEYTIINTHSPTVLRNQLATPCILCVDEWEHWVTVIGHCKNSDRWLVIDPARTRPMMLENHCRVMRYPDLQRRWMAPASIQTDPGDKTFYGFVVHSVQGVRVRIPD